MAVIDVEGRLAFTASGKGGGGAYAWVSRPGSGIELEELGRLILR